MIKLLKAAALAFVGALSLGSAALAEGDRSAELRVTYGDLDLSRPDGAAAFATRVDTAVESWCADNLGAFAGQRGISAAASCRKHAQAVVRLRTPEAEKRALRVAAAAARQPAISVAAR